MANIDPINDHDNATDESSPVRPKILVPIAVLEGESIPEGVDQLLARAHIVLLGYHEIPEQTAAGQARMQFEDRAQEKLEQFETTLEAAGAVVERRLVFTHDAQKTFDRQIHEHDCLGVLVPNACEGPEDVLVAVRGTVGVDRVVRLVAGLFADTDVTVTLYHIVSEDETEHDAKALLEGVSDRLVHHGLTEAAIAHRIEQTAEPVDAIVDTARAFDAVVMGETNPSVATYVFGMPSEQIAQRFLGPVLVVQRERPDDEDSSVLDVL